MKEQFDFITSRSDRGWPNSLRYRRCFRQANSRYSFRIVLTNNNITELSLYVVLLLCGGTQDMLYLE